jgi:hypothetical protein
LSQHILINIVWCIGNAVLYGPSRQYLHHFGNLNRSFRLIANVNNNKSIENKWHNDFRVMWSRKIFR